uniref:DUF19 domain-containing protein n=1 Tax=Caenorhabditis tropicalis TaxID=1561998 RepID=A0A1I7UWC2_9PELO
MNDTIVRDVVSLCRDTEKCMNENCKYTESQRKDIKSGCDVLDLASSSFSMCLAKIEKTKPKPNFKKYECLKGIDFHNEEKSNVCEKFHKKADCVKTIMSDFCGKDKIDDYQIMVDYLKIDADEDGRRRWTTCRLEEALRRKTIEEGRASAAGKKNYPDGECPAGRSVVGIHFAVLLTRFAWKEKSSEIFLQKVFVCRAFSFFFLQLDTLKVGLFGLKPA